MKTTEDLSVMMVRLSEQRKHFLDNYSEGFDEYGDYSDILSYSSSEIEVEYKQPGYVEINRRKYIVILKLL